MLHLVSLALGLAFDRAPIGQPKLTRVPTSGLELPNPNGRNVGAATHTGLHALSRGFQGRHRPRAGGWDLLGKMLIPC